jgi:hypothetical protein
MLLALQAVLAKITIADNSAQISVIVTE